MWRYSKYRIGLRGRKDEFIDRIEELILDYCDMQCVEYP